MTVRGSLTRRLAAALFALALLGMPTGGASAQGAGDATVQEITTTDPLGHRVVTERTLLGGRLVKEEVTVTSASGQVLSRTETRFDPATGQVVSRETVTVAGGTVTTVEQKFRDGQLAAMEATTVTTTGGQRVTVAREFAVVGGVLTEVSHERKVERDDHPGAPAGVENRQEERSPGTDLDRTEVEASGSTSSHDGDGRGGDGGKESGEDHR